MTSSGEINQYILMFYRSNDQAVNVCVCVVAGQHPGVPEGGPGSHHGSDLWAGVMWRCKVRPRRAERLLCNAGGESDQEAPAGRRSTNRSVLCFNVRQLRPVWPSSPTVHILTKPNTLSSVTSSLFTNSQKLLKIQWIIDHHAALRLNCCTKLTNTE